MSTVKSSNITASRKKVVDLSKFLILIKSADQKTRNDAKVEKYKINISTLNAKGYGTKPAAKKEYRAPGTMNTFKTYQNDIQGKTSGYTPVTCNVSPRAQNVPTSMKKST